MMNNESRTTALLRRPPLVTRRRLHVLAVLAGAGLLGLVLVTSLAARSHAGAVKPAPETVTVAVQLETAHLSDLRESLDVGGQVRARSVATIVSRVVGDIREVRVEPGTRVRAGQTLIVLDGRELVAEHARASASLAAARRSIDAVTADRAAAEASLELATATHRRIADLRAKNSATPHELDEAIAALRAGQARVQAAEARCGEAEAQAAAATAAADASAVTASYAVLAAPFDGVVTRKLVEAGNTATPGTPLLTVEDTRAFRLEVQVDESRASLVSLGQSVPVFLDTADGPAASTATPMSGRVSEIERAVDAGTHAVLVKVDLQPATNLRSGMYGRARFPGAVRRTLVVPASSVVHQGQLTFVFVADRDERAHLRMVRPGASVDSMVEIVAGLSDGERVVVAPGPALADGSRISARKEH